MSRRGMSFAFCLSALILGAALLPHTAWNQGQATASKTGTAVPGDDAEQWIVQRPDGGIELKLPPYVRRLTYFGERPDWSHDGKHLIFLEKTFGDVFEYELATGIIRPMTHHYFHYGYSRALYLANGDILLSGANEFSKEDPWRSRFIKAELWVLDKSLTKPATPLGVYCYEGPAASRTKMRIAWTTTHDNYPDEIPAAVRRFWISDIEYVDGRPTLANKRKLIDSDIHTYRLMETSHFRPPLEKELAFTAAFNAGDVAANATQALPNQAAHVAGLDLETGKIVQYANIRDQFEESAGFFPDGQYLAMKSNRGDPSTEGRHIDIWKLKMDGSGEAERLTYFAAGHSGYKGTNPHVSDDGRYMAFQIGKDGEVAGIGHGIFLYDFEAARKYQQMKKPAQ